MKLAKLILPIRDNQYQMIEHVHAYLMQALVERWNGFTAYAGDGGWRRGDAIIKEPVMIYEIAMPLADVVRLRTLASEIAREARQECVMMVTPNGDVEFVKPRLDLTVETA